MILVEMGCLTEYKDGQNVMRRKGWDILISEFDLSHTLEVEKSELDRKAIWYIKLGHSNGQTPTSIYKLFKESSNHMFPPECMHSRRATSFVAKQLVSTLKSSSLFSKLMKSIYYNYADTNIGKN